MKILNLTDYKYKVLAEQILMRETNLFHYQFNIDNYKEMINHCKDQEYKEKLLKLVTSEELQKERELLTYNALLKQIDDDQQLLEAIEKNVP